MLHGVASRRVSEANRVLELVSAKGFLGPNIGRGANTVGGSAARAAGVVVDGNGRLRCPPGGHTAEEFTDFQMSNCVFDTAQTVAESVAKLGELPKSMRSIRNDVYTRIGPDVSYSPNRSMPIDPNKSKTDVFDEVLAGGSLDRVPDLWLEDIIHWGAGDRSGLHGLPEEYLDDDGYLPEELLRFDVEIMKTKEHKEAGEVEISTGQNLTYWVVDRNTGENFFLKSYVKGQAEPDEAEAEMFINGVADAMGLPVSEVRLASAKDGDRPSASLLAKHVEEHLTHGVSVPLADKDWTYMWRDENDVPYEHDVDNLFSMLFLDFSTANTDRHPGNMFLIEDDNGRWHMVPIDHGKALDAGNPTALVGDKDIFIESLLSPHGGPYGTGILPNPGYAWIVADMEAHGYVNRDQLRAAFESAKLRLMDVDTATISHAVHDLAFGQDYDYGPNSGFRDGLFNDRRKMLENFEFEDFEFALDMIGSGEARTWGFGGHFNYSNVPEQVTPDEFETCELSIKTDQLIFSKAAEDACNLDAAGRQAQRVYNATGIIVPFDASVLGNWYHGVRQPGDAPVRGVPIDPKDDKIPDTLYHVTPYSSAVSEAGVLRAAGAGGLGGDPRDRLVSMTVDAEVAKRLERDIKLRVTTARDAKNSEPEGFLATLKRDGLDAGWDEDDLDEKLAALDFYIERGDYKTAFDTYLWNRDSATGVENPLFFGDQEEYFAQGDLDPDDVGVFAIDKPSLDNGSMITNFDLEDNRGLKEVRSYGDVVVRGKVRVDGEGEERSESVEPIRKPLKIDTPADLGPIHEAFKANDRRLLLVGGAVRDTLLGREPKDFDLATDAPPEEVIEMLQRRPGLKIDLTGEDFAVVRVKTPDGNEYEIATFRTDIGEGRRPDAVELATIEEDVIRRDLTLNALFYDLDSNEVLDYVGGINDIEKGVVRAVGNPGDRFREDKLRILRSLRFTGRTGFVLDDATKRAIREDSDLSEVSSERVREEFLNGLATAQNPQEYVRLVDDLDLWPQIFPTAESDPDLVINVDRVVDTPNPSVQLAALLSDNDVDVVEKTLKAMRYQNAEIADVKFLHNFSRITPEEAPELKKEFIRRDMEEADLKLYASSLGMQDDEVEAFIEFANAPQSVNSQDLIDQGLKGPAIGEAIRAAETNAYREILERNNVNINPVANRKWTRDTTGIPFEGARPSAFFQVLNADRYSGYKAHVFSTTHEEIDEVLDRIYDVAETRGWAVKTATDRFFDQVDGRHAQHGKGVTVYFPNAANWESEAKELARLMKGYSPSGNISGDEMITDSIGMRYDFAVDPEDSSVRVADVHRFYLAADARETAHSKEKRKQIREFSGRREIEKLLEG